MVSAAVKALPNLALSVSATTRTPRSDDREGVTYHFKSNAEFDELVQNGGLLEWAEVHGQRYGTLTAEVQKALEAGVDLILEIDIQGDEQIKDRFPETYSIFIKPPSFAELKRRLERRATESAQSIEQRLRTAQVEMRAQDRYNAVIVNDDLDRATQEFIETIRSHCTKQSST